jgi:hypothetical protein
VSANFETPHRGVRAPLAAGRVAAPRVTDVGGEGAPLARSLREKEAAAGTSVGSEENDALVAELARRGLVRRNNGFTLWHKGVSWDKTNKKWKTQVQHDGQKEFLGQFATEEEATACYDTRCLELGRRDSVGLPWRGLAQVSKWQVKISLDGKTKFLGVFEATVRGEVDVALAYDVAAWAAGRTSRQSTAALLHAAAAVLIRWGGQNRPTCGRVRMARRTARRCQTTCSGQSGLGRCWARRASPDSAPRRRRPPRTLTR